MGMGKDGAIHLSRRLMDELGIEPGDVLVMSVAEGYKVVLELVPDPLALAIRGKKWARTDVEEFERESEKSRKSSTGKDTETPEIRA